MIPKDLDFLTVSMPWVTLDPSIQLGIVHTVLSKAGLKVGSLSANLDYYSFLYERKLVTSRLQYLEISQSMEYAEWVFTNPTFKGIDDSETLQQILPDLYFDIKAATPEFVEKLALEIVESNPKIVGFTIVLAQFVASLVLAKRIKELNPRIKVIFGGPGLVHGVGEALLENFGWLDAIWHGDAEVALPEFVKGLQAGLTSHPCASIRSDLGIYFADLSNKVEGDQFEDPNHEEFFERIDRLKLDEVKRDVYIQYETGRGCWWGFKHPCTFCAEDVFTTPYRRKNWEKVVADVLRLADQHGVYKFYAVDSILDYKDGTKILESLIESKYNLELFFELKSNTGLEDLKLLKRAGARVLQPGIESLSTPILELISKGVSAIQNVRFLKFCKWLDIPLTWNIIRGFHSEDPTEYLRMAELAYKLQHLYPPNGVIEYYLSRGSQLFDFPEKYGIVIRDPEPIFQFLYPLDREQLYRIATKFNYDGIDSAPYSLELTRVVREWIQNYRQKKGQKLLRYYRLGEKVVVEDERPGRSARYSLDENESRIYHLCLDIVSLDRLSEDPILLSNGFTYRDVDGILRKLENLGLMFREKDRVISLAIPMSDPFST
jgi:ribosomal peptide maturation radical SAM protein 1